MTEVSEFGIGNAEWGIKKSYLTFIYGGLSRIGCAMVIP